MSDELEAGELRPLPDRVEAVRRRWFADWTTDEGLEYVFARGDIRTVLEGYDALVARVAASQWEPVAQSLEYDLITHAIKHGEIPQGYRIYRSKELTP